MQAYDPVAREPLPDGTRYRLPWRSRAPFVGIAGAVCCAFGLLFAGVPTFGTLLHGGGPALLFTLPFVLAGLAALLLGLLLLFGRTEIDVTREHVLAREWLGLFRVTRRRARADVRTLRVVQADVRTNGRTVPGYGTLLAEDGAGNRLVLVVLHRVAVLQSLGQRLQAELGLGGGAVPLEQFGEHFDRPGADAARAAGTPSTAGAGAADAAPPLAQPASSRAVLERNVAGFLLTLPPFGLRHGLGALIACGALFAAAPLAIAVAGARNATRDGVPFPFALAFAAVGALLAVLGVRLARARAMLAVANGDLLIRRDTPFGTRRHELPAGSVLDVRVARSTTEVNHRPLLQLVVEPRDGTPLRLLTGRDESELRWIADLVRRELRL